MTRSVCVVTTSRADYGLLYHPIAALRRHDGFETRIVVTGSHLAARFGCTVAEIERDGVDIDARVKLDLDADDGAALGHAIGQCASGFAKYFARRRPDIVMVLGDRFELLGIVSAATVARIPVAHLCGGDITEGSYDDAIRHAVTKLAHLHFPSNAASAERIVAMGERADRVYNVGSPGLDFVRAFNPMSRAELSADLGLDASAPWLLVTFHPETLALDQAERETIALTSALHSFAGGHQVVITAPNADSDGKCVASILSDWADTQDNAQFVASLGQRRYLSMMKESEAVVGNSSSGLYEAPSFGVPTVNVGHRQAGRLRARSVIDCEATVPDIVAALQCAQRTGHDASVVNPYGDGHTSARIVAALSQRNDWPGLLRKEMSRTDVSL